MVSSGRESWKVLDVVWWSGDGLFCVWESQWTRSASAYVDDNILSRKKMYRNRELSLQPQIVSSNHMLVLDTRAQHLRQPEQQVPAGQTSDIN